MVSVCPCGEASSPAHRLYAAGRSVTRQHLSVRGLEQLLPAREQFLQLLACGLCAASISVSPQSSASCRSSSASSRSRRLDRRLDSLELARTRRSLLAASASPCAPSAVAAPGRALVAADADVVGPAAVVGAQAAVLDRDDPLGDGIEHCAVVRDEQDRAGKRLERRLERLAAFEVEVVRRLVEDEEVRAGGDDEREREPPALAARELRRPASRASSQPEKRKRPSSACACGRCRPVAPIAHSSTLPRSSSSTSCCEKYASSTPWPIRPSRRPADDRLQQRRLARAVRADQSDMLAALEHELGVRRAAASCPRRGRSPRPRPPSGRSATGFRNSKPSVRRPARGASTRSASIRAICFSFACACRDFVP